MARILAGLLPWQLALGAIHAARELELGLAQTLGPWGLELIYLLQNGQEEGAEGFAGHCQLHGGFHFLLC